MAARNPVTKFTLAAASELRAVMQGKVVLSGDDDYDRTRRIWNGAVDRSLATASLASGAQGRRDVHGRRGEKRPVLTRVFGK